MAGSSKPRRLWANDAGDIFMQDTDGRFFELDRGASLMDDGLPIDDSLTTYSPASNHGDLSGMTAEEALYLLEAIACVFSEGWAPQVGPRFSSLNGDQIEALVNRVIAATGIDPANLRDLREM